MRHVAQRTAAAHRKAADHLALIRRMQTEAINHDPAVTFFQTGFQFAGRPSIGAWICLRTRQRKQRPAGVCGDGLTGRGSFPGPGRPAVGQRLPTHALPGREVSLRPSPCFHDALTVEVTSFVRHLDRLLLVRPRSGHRRRRSDGTRPDGRLRRRGRRRNAHRRRHRPGGLGDDQADRRPDDRDHAHHHRRLRCVRRPPSICIPRA